MQPSGGACDVLENPNLGANAARPFWSPETSPDILPLVPASLSDAADWSVYYEPQRWPGSLTSHTDEAGLFLILGDQKQEHRPWFPQGSPNIGAPLQFAVSGDAFVTERLGALRRFWHWVVHGAGIGLPKITEQQRRLARTLVALDARRAGASYREIAELILGPERVKAEWSRITPLRDPMRTLVKNGFALMQGGYRLLLKPRKRKHRPPP